jgi:hypothetical protein
MRWDRLFHDLEAQLAAAASGELAAEVEDRTRREVARLRLVDRLRPALGSRVELSVTGAGTLIGTLERVGPDWLLLDLDGQPEAVVVTAALRWVRDLPVDAVEPGSEGAVTSRLGLAHALRQIARDRSPVVVVLRDGVALSGTLDRVGADFVDLAEHAPGEVRRAREVVSRATVGFAAIALVRAG